MPIISSPVLSLSTLLSSNPLYVFALEQEATEVFSDLNPLFVGIGKVNATYHLTKKITKNRPGIIVNLGSAGSNKYNRGQVVCCTKFIQRDMDVTALGFEKYQTPFSTHSTVLTYGLKVGKLAEGICGSGDNFETSYATVHYDVIDMEAYALALVAKQEEIPFLCLKYISDGANGQAAEDWSASVHHAARALKEVWDVLIRPE